MTDQPLSYTEERALREAEEMARWAKRNAHHTTDRLPVQIASGGMSNSFKRPLHGGQGIRASIPRIVAEAAWEGYAADGHGSQSCERLHERGGFGLSELGYYLARAVDEGRIRIEIVR